MTKPSASSAAGATQTRYRRIFESLKDRILAGEYGAGHRVPSESALVKRFGVSRPTAARALKELVLSGLVERRAGAGSFVVEKPLAAAGQRQLGLLIPQWETTEIFEMICGQLASLARTQDFVVQWSSARGRDRASNGQGAGERRTGEGQEAREARAGERREGREAAELAQAERLCEEFVERKVGGVFFAPLELSRQQAEVNRRIGETFRQAGIPLVLVDRDMERFPHRGAFDVVGMDNVAAGHLAATHLLKLGCRRVMFFTKPMSAATVAARIAGVREALAGAGLEWDAGSVIEGDPADAVFVKSCLLKRKPEACICANDRTAAELLQTLLRAGFRVPHDLRVTGFDDVRYATLMAVPLTTVHQPCDEIAAVAFDAMLRRLADPLAPVCNFLVAPRLVVRESCGTYLPR
ncbi:MAG: GntR family transcriptional regulator [Opitutaceae bacterium]|jgi:LacI family transcriptional regulator|nr:GntR family transcriptional regulator [Opitutaceae bacterium]